MSMSIAFEKENIYSGLVKFATIASLVLTQNIVHIVPNFQSSPKMSRENSPMYEKQMIGQNNFIPISKQTKYEISFTQNKELITVKETERIKIPFRAERNISTSSISSSDNYINYDIETPLIDKKKERIKIPFRSEKEPVTIGSEFA